MYEIAYGNRYDRSLDTADVAKIIRKEIRRDVKVGKLPKGKYGVRIQRFSGGSSIRVAISDLGFHVHNPERVRFDLEHPNTYPGNLEIYNERARELVKDLEARVGAFNFDGSETMVDYFHVNFYAHVGFDHEWEGADRGAMILEMIAEGGLSEEATRNGESFCERQRQYGLSETMEALRFAPIPGH